MESEVRMKDNFAQLCWPIPTTELPVIQLQQEIKK